MTSYGHVVVALGRSGSEYVVNDPAGRWAQTWKGSYPYGWNAAIGRQIRYGQAAFEQAVATSNGSTYLPLWYHELTGVDATTLPSSDSPDGGSGSTDDGATEGGADGGSGDAGGTDTVGDEQPFPWANVTWVTPQNGDDVGNPVLLQARREGGEQMEFWSGPWRLVQPTVANPTQQEVTFEATGTRTLTVKNVSQWGTVLAQSTIAVDVAATGSLSPLATQVAGMSWQMQATTNLSAVQDVRYSVDGWDLTDETTGLSLVPEAGNNWPLTYTFNAEANDRLLVAKGYDASGNLVAEGSTIIDVFLGAPSECAVAGAIACGQTVSGDLTDPSSTSDVLNGYPDLVGNWAGPEMAWTWSGGSGEVEIRFLDAHPSELDLDIIVLKQAEGVCVAPDFAEVGWTGLTFEAESGATYTFVVDGYDGDVGPFQLEVDCSP
jgi:hypothetical protein